jgi:hypothetical protein
MALAALQAINTYGPSLTHPFWIANVPQKYRKKKYPKEKQNDENDVRR